MDKQKTKELCVTIARWALECRAAIDNPVPADYCMHCDAPPAADGIAESLAQAAKELQEELRK